jgi:hypothetical protein
VGYDQAGEDRQQEKKEDCEPGRLERRDHRGPWRSKVAAILIVCDGESPESSQRPENQPYEDDTRYATPRLSHHRFVDHGKSDD